MEPGDKVEERRLAIRAAIESLVKEHAPDIGHKDWLEEVGRAGQIISPGIDHACTPTCAWLPEQAHRAFAILRAQHLFYVHIQHEAQKQADNLAMMRHTAVQCADVRSEAMAVLLEQFKQQAV